MKEIANKEDLAQARATASQIRQGIHNYLATLALIAKANKERHWKVLGYSDWQSYVDGEFGAERLRLPAEHRQKAIEELRLAGLSVRAIGAAVGVSTNTVRKDLYQSDTPDEIIGTDGKTYAASRPSQPAAPAEADAQLDRAGVPSAAEVEALTASHGAGDGAGDAYGAPVPPTAVEGPGASPSTDADGEEGIPLPSTGADAAGAPTDLSTAGAPVIPSAVQAALDKYVPDPNPHREWQQRYFEAIAGVHKVIRFTPEDVADKADDELIDELGRVADALADYRLRVAKAYAANLPDNVTPLRRTS